MQRWHEASCTKPDVEVKDGTPHCRKCDKAPRVSELVAERATSSSVPSVPPDRPMGRMKLWWPPSVPYSADGISISPAAQTDQTLKSPSGDTPTEPSPYTSSLQSSEFRLICLSAVDDYSYPLHLELEVYDLENCPEYETVSYTWAGEDGDGSLCQPIYIGPHWDILLQTKNCWEMLRFIRPWRGTRMVWVDAVCINQQDTLERNSQVANMGRIYSACTRVIVYLGPDIAVPMQKGHPRRRRLHELETGNTAPVFPADRAEASPPPHQLSDLLKRRYFTRVWVVQELLLSQRVVMRVGDVDFWADPATSGYFSSLKDWNWNQTLAAWVQYISQGSSQSRDLKELLWLTASSQATDPRDRVFGLLGIVPEMSKLLSLVGSDLKNWRSAGGLIPDYSLSCQHVFIGLFAYFLINQRQTNILYHASCVNDNMAKFPTWAPDWTNPITWRLLFQSPKITSQEVFTELQKIIKPQDYSWADAPKTYELYELKGPGREHVTKERAWHQNINIDSTSGALRINLTHYMRFQRPLARVGRILGFHVFAMYADPFSVYLLSEQRLDLLIKGFEEDLFVLNIDDQAMMYLVLTGTYNPNHKLVATCPFVMIQVPSHRSDNEIPTVRPLRLDLLQHSLHEALEGLASTLDSKIAWKFLREGLEGLLPGVAEFRQVQSLLIRHFQVEYLGQEYEDRFGLEYVACIDIRFLPSYRDGYFYVTIPNIFHQDRELWRMYTQEEEHLEFFGLPRDRPWECRLRGDTTWKKNTKDIVKQRKSKRADFLEVRFPMAVLHTELNACARDPNVASRLWVIDRLWQTSTQTGEEFEELMMREPRDEDRFVGCASWQGIENIGLAKLWASLGARGSTWQVSIE